MTNGKETIRRLLEKADPENPTFQAPGLVHVDSLQGKSPPPRRWCVPDWIPDRQVTSIYGDGGTGKSLLAMQLATCSALGLPWLGIELATRKVLYVSFEDDRDELMRRQLDINASVICDFSDFEGRLFWLDRSNCEDPAMMTFDQIKGHSVTTLGREIEQLAVALGVQLIVVDTLADAFGGNEIIRSEVRRFVAYLRGIAKTIDGAVVVLAHPSASGIKDRGYSGSTAWRGSVRSLITLSFPDDDDDPFVGNKRVLTRRKSNFSPSGTAVELTYCAGAFVPTSKPGPAAQLDKFTVEALFLKYLEKALHVGECPSRSKNRKEYAPNLLKALYREPLKDVSIRQLEDAMSSLIGAGDVMTKQHRKGASPLCPRTYDIKSWRG